MGTIKTVKLFFFVYTIYTFFVVLVSDYQIWYAVLGLALMWSVYLMLFLGYKSCPQTKQDSNVCYKDELHIIYPLSNIQNWSKWAYYFCGTLSIVCAALAGKYYTGRGVVDVIQGLTRSISAYTLYQQYVQNANFQNLTIARIPYILMLTFCFTILIWGYISLLFLNEKLKYYQVVFLFQVTGATLYFGVARGTNFEMYIVFVMLVFCILNRKRTDSNLRSASKLKKIALVGGIGVLVVNVFKLIVEARGWVFQNQICTEIKYDSNKTFSKFFPTITTLGLSCFRYLGWGIYTMGYVTDQIIFSSVSNLFASLIPEGFSLMKGESMDTIVRNNVDVGAGWIPDYFAFVNHFGWLLFCAVVFLLGRIIARLEKEHYPPLLKNLVSALVFLEMLSIPVGNFIVVSTPLVISTIYIAGWYTLCRLNVSVTVSNRFRKR